MEAPIPHLGNPDDKSLRMYVVTLHKFDDADRFYEDMETPGGNLYIPKRAVECIDRLPISRNTNYMLTYDEAAEIMNDRRVLAVELNPTDLGLVKGTCGFSQYSSKFDKTVASDATNINWGLLRCLRKTDINNWGINGTAQQTAEIISDSSGKNVDVVIMDDGAPYPTVLEYQQNIDGTGYTRMVEYNWFQHNPEVSGTAVDDYQYIANRKQEHGGHTSGTVAGNTQGWARDATIYNNRYLDTNGIQYVRMFHRNKPVNPITGVKNPTIMSNSWGWSVNTELNTSYVSQITIRGVTYYPTGGTFGSYTWDSNVIQNIARLTVGRKIPSRDTATDADMIDAMNEGIIIVASAGNDYSYIDTPDGLDYNNTMVFYGLTYYIHRGSSPGSTWGVSEYSRVICVGATGQHNEASGSSVYASTGIEVGDYKAEYSNYGPRVDCYAPGSGIQSIWNSSVSTYDIITATDPRVAALGLTDIINNNFKKCPGTSMSCPQVAGVLACLAEKYPRITQSDARAYVKNAMPYTVLSTNGGATDTKDAGFTFNPNSIKPMLFLKGTRVPSAEIGGFYPTPFPETVNWNRPATGQVYPRRKITQTSNLAATFALSSDVVTVSNGGIVTFTLNTTNLPDNTLVQYIISAKLTTQPALLYSTSAYSGVCSETTLIASLDTRPYTGNRIQTTGVNATVTSITNSILGIGTLGISTPAVPGGLLFTGTNDDGRWTVPLMFNVTFLGNTYNTIYVGTNSYITFGAGSSAWEGLGAAMPALPKIMISAKDNSCQRIFYGYTGVPPNRTFRIRFEGTASSSGGINLIYEVLFYENNPETIDVQIANNARWGVSFDGDIYPFSSADISVPLVGTLTVNNNLASLPVTITSTSQILLTARLGIFPTPSVNVTVN
jgi:hypothetical protein